MTTTQIETMRYEAGSVAPTELLAALVRWLQEPCVRAQQALRRVIPATPPRCSACPSLSSESVAHRVPTPCLRLRTRGLGDFTFAASTSDVVLGVASLGLFCLLLDMRRSDLAIASWAALDIFVRALEANYLFVFAIVHCRGSLGLCRARADRSKA